MIEGPAHADLGDPGRSLRPAKCDFALLDGSGQRHRFLVGSPRLRCGHWGKLVVRREHNRGSIGVVEYCAQMAGPDHVSASSVLSAAATAASSRVATKMKRPPTGRPDGGRALGPLTNTRIGNGRTPHMLAHQWRVRCRSKPGKRRIVGLPELAFSRRAAICRRKRQSSLRSSFLQQRGCARGEFLVTHLVVVAVASLM